MSDNNKISNFINRAKSTVNEIKENAVQIKDTAIAKQAEYKEAFSEKKRISDLKKYDPIFENTFDNEKLKAERVIRIVNYDPRLENEVCKGSIGFWEKGEDRKMPTLYSKFAATLGFDFYPQLGDSIYIKDPCVEDKYIDIDEYYDYMKKVRVDELTLVAQSLGAKSVSIELKNATNTMFSKTRKYTGEIATADGDKIIGRQKSKSKSIEIWAKTTFAQAENETQPKVPDLLYFKNESDISTLIQMVLESKSKVSSRTYSMKASSTSGISVTEAVSISSLLKRIKCSAGLNFKEDTEKQNNASLEYTIIF